MKPWISFAIVSMFFAGLTSVIAKMGLGGISGELGLAVRTVFVFAFVLTFTALTVPATAYRELSSQNLIWLGASGMTTTLSWIFYYKALKDGEVSTIALIDKGSIVVAIILAFFVLKEQIALRVMFGGALMLAGIVVIAKK